MAASESVTRSQYCVIDRLRQLVTMATSDVISAHNDQLGERGNKLRHIALITEDVATIIVVKATM